MAAIAEVIARANPDIVNLVEIENEAALTTLNDKFLPGRGYRPYFVQGGDTFTGQDVGLLTRIDPDGDQIHFDDREGQSGNVSKSVSKNYNAVITVGDTKILVVGLHFLAQPNRPDRRLQREAQVDAIRSIVISQHLLGTEEVMVMEHSECGMLTFEDADVHRHLVEKTGVDIDLAFHAFSDLETNLREQVVRIRAHPWTKDVPVRGLIYDIDTRELHELH